MTTPPRSPISATRLTIEEAARLRVLAVAAGEPNTTYAALAWAVRETLKRGGHR